MIRIAAVEEGRRGGESRSQESECRRYAGGGGFILIFWCGFFGKGVADGAAGGRSREVEKSRRGGGEKGRRGEVEEDRGAGGDLD